MKLYELTNLFHDFTVMLEQAETIEEVEAAQIALQGIEITFDEKVENIVKMIKNFEGDVLAYKNEETKLKAKRQSAENKVESLKSYLFNNMEFLGKEKVKTELFNVSIRNNAPSVDLYNEEILPEAYLIPLAPKVDKTSIRDALKRGEEVPGAKLVRSRSLQIR
ncbi:MULTISPECIES: siphovirus Gp157 family protein [unclassified Facklamia]|uniref:siphovirus Gp157 family protein n=1 Tax=Aerococcaceae TaxID=186827 RepID=UPI0013B81170|nr:MULTISPECIES: siphovirus Gp157 family protein [unclassified Facklamia]MBS4462902.1 siphovirus Gp157 family protein [Aerococcaceae bacterium zg-B36]NEW65300.1 hypothetical protein [Facklamia sp. 252]NEW68800.1 hypothetical protein [Facklamia sp. 253]QQD66111.1 siphovirus Gp157 family protein [Aerococcaceae bacterium zg-252]